MSLVLFKFFGVACGGGNFLFFPTWYKYLNGTVANGGCTPVITNINDVWLIVAAVVEILLRVAAIVAVVFIIWAGADYMTSQGEPDKVTRARGALINALVGLAIAMLSAGVINFIAESIH